MERRSITVEPELHRKILTFRAFLLAHGLDVDYTTAINVLAEHGFDELRKSELSGRLLERLAGKAALDQADTRAITSDWVGMRILGIEADRQEPAAGGAHIQAARTNPKPLPAKGKSEPMLAYCLRCKVKRQMRDPKIVTLRNGNKAIKGVCPTCGSKMTRFGLPP